MQRNSNYEVVIFWSKDDEEFVAVVPELPGCAADGTSRVEALTNIELAIREWIETAISLGRNIPEPRVRSFA